jgi:hypothetical protein
VIADAYDNAEMPRIRLIYMLMLLIMLMPFLIVILMIMLSMPMIGQTREGDM